MSKSVLLSIQPQWVCKILNGEKTIEVRKQFPKDYKGWVYIYNTKNNNGLNDGNVIGRCYPIDIALKVIGGKGKVVGRFWCDNVREITTDTWTPTYERWLLEKSCLTESKLFDYIDGDTRTKPFYAIHIGKLEIFDKPKELKEFAYYGLVETEINVGYRLITKAPQNYCYVEVEDE